MPRDSAIRQAPGDGRADGITLYANWGEGFQLFEDNSLRGESTLLVNLRTAWTPRIFHGFEVYGELPKVFDSKRHDIDYFYATRFPGEPPEGVEDFNGRMVEPRPFRVGVKKTFGGHASAFPRRALTRVERVTSMESGG